MVASPAVRSRLLAAVVVTLGLVAGCGRPPALPGAPSALEELLGVLPATALEDGAAYVDRSVADLGVATVLPGGSGGLAALALDQAAQLLETSGDDLLTLLAGDVDVRAVTTAAQGLGYTVTAEAGWQVFRRPGAPAPGAPPIVTAVPAGAVRRGTAVLGAEAGVDAVVSGGRTALDLGWPQRLAQAVGPAAAVVLLGAPPDLSEAARRAGLDPTELAARAGPPLPAYEGYALSVDADGEGVVALAREEADVALAEALALRAAAGPVTGGRWQRMAQVLAGGAPTVHAEAGLVVLPVTWHAAPADVRAALADGGLPFLAPRP
jgi:hypothetical protein